MASALGLLVPSELPHAGMQFFRVSRTGPFIAVLTVGAWLAACAWVWWMGGLDKVRIPPALAGWAVSCIGIYWLYVLNDFRKTLRSDAWVAALGPDGVYVNLRSYRNLSWEAPRRHVALVPYSLIAQARGERHADPDASTDGSSRYVELKLFKTDTAGLAAQLAEETDGPPAALPLVRIAWKSSPVALEEGTLRIGWRATPDARVFLDHLARRGVSVAQPWAQVMMRAS